MKDIITVEPFRPPYDTESAGQPAYTVNGVQLLVSVADMYDDETLLSRALSYGGHPSMRGAEDKNIYAYLWAERVGSGVVTP